MIATGFGATVLRLAVAEARFDLMPDSADLPQAGVWTDSDGKQFSRYAHTFKSLGIGEITLHNSVVYVEPINIAAHGESTGSRIADINSQQPDMYIGMNLLKQLASTSPIPRT
jgi:hypothetical protein